MVPASIPFETAELVSLVLESALLGVSLVLLPSTLRVLVKKRALSPSVSGLFFNRFLICMVSFLQLIIVGVSSPPYHFDIT